MSLNRGKAIATKTKSRAFAGTPSLDLDMEAAQEAESTNVMLNRYSVSANLNQLRSVGTLGDLDFESEFADDSPEKKEAIEIGDAPK